VGRLLRSVPMRSPTTIGRSAVIARNRLLDACRPLGDGGSNISTLNTGHSKGRYQIDRGRYSPTALVEYMGIYLSGRYVSMDKQLLYGSDVIAGFNQMGRKTVPEGVA
jgi:hypothetical protein